ncbi:MAG: hypothetical protein KF746_06015 [Chitinophagaceae bacterium]|nr:hypothetical protein [Chitinophagaceae bacterium]
MKKMSLSILAIAITFTGIYAQEKTDSSFKQRKAHAMDHHPGKMRKGPHADYSKLNLSKEQQDALVKINQDYRNSMTELRKKEATTTVKDYKEQMQALNKKRHEQVQNIFTPEQKDQLAKMRAERKSKFDSSAKNRHQKMKADLGLSNDQSAKMKTLREATGKKVKAIKEDASLTDQEKKQQVMAAFKQQHEDMKSILTPEQMKKLENGRKAYPRKMTK